MFGSLADISGSFIGGGNVGKAGTGDIVEEGSGEGRKISTVGVAAGNRKLQARAGIISRKIQNRFIKIL
jgi:hypothetical protein